MDRVERLVRGSRPADDELTSRAETDLARILKTEAFVEVIVESPWRHSLTARWVLPAAAAIIAAVVITGIGLFHPSQAVAATPPMLTITPVRSDAAAVLRKLQTSAAGQADRSAEHQIITQWWGLASDVDASGTILASRVEPRRRVAQLGNHGISSYTDYSAQAYDVRGRPTSGVDSPAAGTKLETTKLDPDQQVFTHDPPTDPAKFGTYLDAALGANSEWAAVNAFSGIGSLLAERVLSPAQFAAFLGYLGTLSDINVLGSSTDRLGRSVLVLASPVQEDNQLLLMVAPDTGSVMGTEVIYRGHERTDIPSPAVTEYVVWEGA